MPDGQLYHYVVFLKTIEDNIGLITRENYVCYDGLPYDYEAVHKKCLTNLQGDGRDVHIGSLPTGGQEAGFTSERAHRSFDRLSKVAPENRKRTDLLRLEIFRFLENQVKKCDDIKKYVDKFIAHAAAPETRPDLTENQKAITLER